MFSVLKKSMAAFLTAAALLPISILIGCLGSGATGQDGLNPTTDSGESEDIISTVVTDGIPLSSIFWPPRNV